MSDFPTHIIRELKHKAFGAEERIVLFVLADRMKTTDDCAWPKVETIASNCGISERTARDVISWLIGIGVVLVHRSENDTGGARALKIDFARLECLSGDIPSRCFGQRKTLSKRSGAPVNRQRAHTERNGAHPESAYRPGAPLHLTGAPQHDDRQGAPSERRPLPPKEPFKDQEKEPTKAPAARKATRDATNSPAPKKATRATQWPDGLVLTAEMIAYAVNCGMAGATQAAHEFERFENYHKSKGSKFADWKLAFYNWVRNWEERKNKSSFVRDKPRNAGQTDMPEDFFARQDARLAAEYGQ